MRALPRSVLLALMLVLPGCAATHVAPQSLRPLRGCTDLSADLPKVGWWDCLGDPGLSALIERALAAVPAPGLAAGRLPAEISRRYIALRAQQTALVLLAGREELDSQRVTIARQRDPAAAAQLAATRADQARTRTEIAALRDGLAVLTHSPRETLDSLPDGPIPLPPPAPMVGNPAAKMTRQTDLRPAASGLAVQRGSRAARQAVRAAQQDATTTLLRYSAARVAAADAQSQALSARATAARRAAGARDGTLAPEDALDADRYALDALQAEERARAAMTQAYVVLIGSRGSR